jgi:Tfp pilus assembly protein PilO
MNFITPIILILISFGVFFGYVDKNYRGENLGGEKRSVKSLMAEESEYKSALDNTVNLRSKREQLIDKRSQITPADLERLEKLLPDNIDNIKLVIDMNNIAADHGLTLKSIKLDTEVKSDSSKLGKDENKYGIVGLTFSVSASYENFLNFLTNLEKSLRLVDITDLSVSGSDSGVYDFTVGLKTYWLK